MVRRTDERLARLTVVLDAGAVLGLARGDRHWRARLREVRLAGVQVVVAEAAVRAPSLIFTSDEHDLRAFAEPTDGVRLVSWP